MQKIDKILNRNIDELNSVYIVYGEEKYLLEEFEEKFIEKFIPKEDQDFNLSFLSDDKEEFIKTLNNMVKTVPLMSGKRFIITYCDKFFMKKNNEDEKLIKILQEVPQQTIIIILINGVIDKRLKINKKLKDKVKYVELNPPRYQKLDRWIKNKFTKEDKHIDKKSINLLEDMFNNNLQRLSNEIEKIIIYNYNRKNIRYDDILKVISRDRLLEDDTIFKLTDALAEKKKKKVLILLNEMIKANESPILILAMIYRQLKLLLKVKVLKSEGMGYKKIASELSQHPYPVKKCYYQSKNFSEEELEILMERFLKANYEMLTGKYEKQKMALEMALLKI
ncbi:MAG: DNA polymerase III subunit delta [bacterium]